MRSLCRSLIVLVLLFGVNILLAEQFTVPEKTGTCTAADANSAIEFSTSEQIITNRNEDLYIGIKTVLDLYRNNQKNQLALVDVRPAEEYAQFRIPNTVNLQLHQLKYKKYLKSKTLVLVNSGKHYRDIEATTASLRLQGYKNVYVLEGGIRKWYTEANLLDGQVSKAKQLNLISVKDFLSEASHGPWVVFDLDEQKTFKTTVNGQIINLPFDSLFELNLASKINEHEHKSMSRYLFVSNDKNIYQNIVPTINKKGINNYHILSQTTDYIKVFQKKNRNANLARKNVIKGCVFK